MSEPLSFMNSWGQREWGESGKICNRPGWRLWAEWPGASKYRPSLVCIQIWASTIQEYFCNPTDGDGESDDDDAVLLMSLAISAPTLLSGLREGVVQRSKYQRNCQESHRSVIYDWETLMFITIINVDCFKCLKTQFALHGRCETSNGYT